MTVDTTKCPTRHAKNPGSVILNAVDNETFIIHDADVNVLTISIPYRPIAFSTLTDELNMRWRYSR